VKIFTIICQSNWFKAGAIYLSFRIISTTLIFIYGIFFSEHLNKVSSLILLFGISSHDFGLRRIGAHPEIYKIEFSKTLFILFLSITLIHVVTEKTIIIIDLLYLVLSALLIAITSIYEGYSENIANIKYTFLLQLVRSIVLGCALLYATNYQISALIILLSQFLIIYQLSKKIYPAKNNYNNLKKTFMLPAMSSYSLLSISVERVTLINNGFLTINGLLCLDISQRSRSLIYAFFPSYLSERKKNSKKEGIKELVFVIVINTITTVITTTIISLFYYLERLEIFICIIIPSMSTLAWILSLRLDVCGLSQTSHSISVAFSITQSLLIIIFPKDVIYISLIRYFIEAITYRYFYMRYINEKISN
jgi:hypothetical protein